MVQGLLISFICLYRISILSTHYFIGIDGGATQTRIRIEDGAGRLLGQGKGGPANIRLSTVKAWDSILEGLEALLLSLNLSLNQSYSFHVGMGLAGCEMKESYISFLEYPHIFKTLVLSSDAYTACLGAHQGQNGAIIIAGTGVVGLQIEGDKTSKISGYGFPHDDEGSGAWLGLEATKHLLQCLDGRLPMSGLAQDLQLKTTMDLEQWVEWANKANSTAFATLAPMVIAAAEAKDPVALSLLHQAAYALDKVALALYAQQVPNTEPLPCSLLGGIAPFLKPYLSKALQARLHTAELPPEAGAIILVKRYLKEHEGAHG